MSGKIDQYSFRGEKQEQIDFKDQVTQVLNFGKQQMQVVTARPTHTGQAGQMVMFIDSTGGVLYGMTSGSSTLWVQMTAFLY